MSDKQRVDALLLARGLVESRSQAQRLVMAGQVRVNGQVVLKPGQKVAATAEVVIARPAPFVSRGGEKLAAALDAFPIAVEGRVCADVGASTGGFTDCLLQRGAARVYAVDVGKGQLHWKLRNDPRVVVMEETNARYVAHLPEPVTLVTVDVSFISLRVILPVVRGWFPENARSGSKEQGEVVALIKPQFEAGRREAARGRGVIRDPAVHRRALSEVLNFAQLNGYGVRGLVRSPVRGPKGNVEFLAWLVAGAMPASTEMLTGWIETCMAM
jgi:23S rRNA (cytidine1920-2'-O)/16S rRNA (cytidine1409-2'-O)-methyltransferase